MGSLMLTAQLGPLPNRIAPPASASQRSFWGRTKRTAEGEGGEQYRRGGEPPRANHAEGWASRAETLRLDHWGVVKATDALHPERHERNHDQDNSGADDPAATVPRRPAQPHAVTIATWEVQPQWSRISHSLPVGAPSNVNWSVSLPAVSGGAGA
ncbi:hypothetical protein GCM10009790_00840 [Georgenia ruanii]